MTQELFHAAKLKVKRANQHIRDFNDLIDSFIKTDFYRLSVEKDVNTAQSILRLQILTSIPDEASLIVGDAIHNLRAALDLLMFELVTLCSGREPIEKLYFPITKTRKELKRRLGEGEIKAVDTSIINIIRDVIKPYNGGNNALYPLNRLDITDKHKLLIMSYTVVQLTGVTGRIGDTGRFIDNTFEVGENRIVNFIGSPFEIELENNGNPTLKVVFNKGETFEGEPVIPTLHHLSQTVSSVIEHIEKAYLAQI